MKKTILILLLLPAVLFLSGCDTIYEIDSYTKDCIVVWDYNENYKTYSERTVIFDCNWERYTIEDNILVVWDKRILHFSSVNVNTLQKPVRIWDYLYYEKPLLSTKQDDWTRNITE